MRFADAAAGAVADGVCAYLQLQENATSFFSRFPGPNPNDLAQFYNCKICNECGEPPGPQPPRFTGGQCPDTFYEVTLSYTAGDGDAESEVVTVQRGPLSGPFNIDYGPQPDSIYRFDLTFDNNAGQIVTSRFNRNVGNNASGFQFSVAPAFGGSDDCGDQGPPPFPTGGDTFPISFTYVDNSDNSVNLSGTVNLFAPVVVGPTVIAPVRVELPDFTFDGTLELAPNFEFNFGPSGVPEDPGAPVQNPGIPQPDTSPETPQDDSDRRLIGMVVKSRIVGSPTETELGQFGAPNLFVPRLANAYFRTRAGGVPAWLGPLDVKTTDAFLPVPEGVFAVSGTAVPERGWECTVSLVFEDTDTGDT